MDIQIYKLDTHNLDSFWNLFAEVLQSEFPGYTPKVIDFMLQKIYSRSAYAYWLQNGTKAIFIAVHNTEQIGFAVVDEPYGGVSFCRWLGVKKKYQKKGVGRGLIAVWLDYAKSAGAHKVELAAQPEAREFYKKVGLIEEGKRESSYFGIDQYVFGKVIGTPRDEVMTRAL